MSGSSPFNKIALCGKPNSGKSTLFNLMTGLNQKIGNYGGVTVEKKSGKLGALEVVDLPGLRSLKAITTEEKIARDEIINYKFEKQVFVFVANGMLLADHLFLFSEIADLLVSMILVINYKDDLEKNRVEINIDKIRDLTGCEVVLMNSITGEGIEELKKMISDNKFSQANTFCRNLYDKEVDGIINNRYEQFIASFDEEREEIQQEDYIKREKLIQNIIASSTKNISFDAHLSRSKKWDEILLHPIWGLIIFLAVMYLVFQAVFTISAYPMDWIDRGMAALSSLASDYISIPWLSQLVSDAIIQGIAGVIIFIPQIAVLFFLLGVLEHTGYLSRISFISDRFLRHFGLSGKSIIPLMSSWACAIPAIMGARIIDDPKEKMAVIMAAPLMTCSARLPVYTILIAVLIPIGSNYDGYQGLALLLLYLVGVIATLVVAWVYSKRTDIKSNPFWSLELPVYRMPNWKSIFVNMYRKTRTFVIQAGKVIFAISILLWFLAVSGPKSDSFVDKEYQSYLQKNLGSEQISRETFDIEYSYLGYIGKSIEPIIQPLGYDWKIGIALVSSFAAREVFVATLSTIYSIGSENETSIVNRLHQEINIKTGAKRFNIATTISLLIFYIFALQCMSTVAVVKQETSSWKFAISQFILMFIMAYVFAFAAFQLLN